MAVAAALMIRDWLCRSSEEVGRAVVDGLDDVGAGARARGKV